MHEAIAETERRRAAQIDHNRRHGITPETIKKALSRMLDGDAASPGMRAALDPSLKRLSLLEVRRHVERLTKDMYRAAEKLEFERAAELRDQVRTLEQRELELR